MKHLPDLNTYDMEEVSAAVEERRIPPKFVVPVKINHYFRSWRIKPQRRQQVRAAA